MRHQYTQQTITIYTPNATAVTAKVLTSGDLSQQVKDAIKALWLNEYNNRITFQYEATTAFNCHGYAWKGNYWINTPEDDKYWDDESYYQVTDTTLSGLRVSFGADDHSAITTGTSGYFISKWGDGPLFEHAINDCPYDPSNNSYYTPCISSVQNETYTSDITIRGCNTIEAENITISSNSNVIFDGIEAIVIDGTFEVQSGSALELKF